MLKRAPTISDGSIVDRLQESRRVSLPFKQPTLAKSVQRDLPQRKRKRVSYKEAQDDSDSDGDENSRKKKRKGLDDAAYGDSPDLSVNIRKFPKFEAKPFSSIANRRFSIPQMTNSKGELIPTSLTNISLGIRPQAILLPRPLHDPMQDHAIVLYDPTIDERETEEEKQERLRQEEKDRAMKEAEEKNKGLFNPHKSLRQLLGEDIKERKKVSKVAVVLCPKLTKVLRPHQIEGVKVIHSAYIFEHVLTRDVS